MPNGPRCSQEAPPSKTLSRATVSRIIVVCLFERSFVYDDDDDDDAQVSPPGGGAKSAQS